MTTTGPTPWLWRLPIVLRLVLTVAAAMFAVLTATSALVYTRVELALDRQLNEDVASYQHALVQALRGGRRPPAGSEGSGYQVLTSDGLILQSSRAMSRNPLLNRQELIAATDGATLHRDRGQLLPISPHALRLKAEPVDLPDRTVVAVVALQRGHRDEALRELLAQLAIAAALTLIASSYVGYRTARAALDPVERYRRRAATLSDGAPGLRLPVPSDRDDELSRLGHTLNGMLDRLAAANERERQFIADASHELRTPLALLRAELDVAMHRPRTAAQLTETLHSVDSEVQRLIDLSNALLDLDELRSTESITRAPINLPALVDSAVAPYRVRAERFRRTITIDVTVAVAEVAERWIVPALGNLLDNAIRHGAGDIQVTATISGGRLRLSVTDAGPGFPAEFLPRAFDRFSRAEVSRTSPGSGLGLAFVIAVAAAHAGTAHACNNQKGATIILEIPCLKPSL